MRVWIDDDIVSMRLEVDEVGDEKDIDEFSINHVKIETDATPIAKASTYLIACGAVTLVIDLVAFTFITRRLTQTEMGVTVALSFTIAVAHILSDLGFSSGLIKYIAEYKGRILKR